MIFEQELRTKWLYQNFVHGNLDMVFENAKFLTEIAEALPASSEGLFIFICVNCALCCLKQATSLSFPFPRPTSWEKRAIFSHPNYVFSCILSAQCCLLQRMRQAELKSWLVLCHSKLCIVVLREGRRSQNSWGHNYTFSDSDSLAKFSDISFIFLQHIFLT